MLARAKQRDDLRDVIELYLDECENGFTDVRLARRRIVEYLHNYQTDEFISQAVHRYNGIKRGERQ